MSPAPLPRFTPTDAGPRPSVLLVEDSVMNRQVALALLEELGYRADAVVDGFEALAALDRSAYAAILMDCHMPRMDGFTASAEIRRREGPARHTPIIAMTANAMQGDRELCLAAGMDDYIAKPIRLDRLDAALRRWTSCERGLEGRTGPDPERPAPVSVTVAEPVDAAPLDRLRALQRPGQPDPALHLIRMFLRDSPYHIAALAEALRRGDTGTLRRVAHTLKGEAANLGARVLQERCARLEALGRLETTDGAAEALEAVRSAYQQVEAVLGRLVRGEST